MDVSTNYCIGKILFWTWLHVGSWPKWLDPLHFQYIIEGDESVMCLKALREHIPYLYFLANDLNLRQDELEHWIIHNGLNVS